jgi:uncharacterized protein YukE
MASQLRDRNLRQAKDELARLSQALGMLNVNQAGNDVVGAADPVGDVLAWIDWNESQLQPSVQALGAKQRMGTAIGELSAAIDGIQISRNAALDAWKGTAANAFRAYSDVLLENCRKIVPELEAMARTMSDDHSAESVPHNMKELTKNVWKAAGVIADDPKTRKGIDAVLQAGRGGTSLEDGRLSSWTPCASSRSESPGRSTSCPRM